MNPRNQNPNARCVPLKGGKATKRKRGRRAHFFVSFHERKCDNYLDKHRYSSGSARLINKIATHSLLYSTQNGQRVIDDRIIARVIEGELS